MITANADQEVHLLMAACLTAVRSAWRVCPRGDRRALAVRRGYRIDQMSVGSSTSTWSVNGKDTREGQLPMNLKTSPADAGINL